MAFLLKQSKLSPAGHNSLTVEVTVIRHLIWDVDGTLFDTYPAIVRSFQAALYDLGALAAYDEIMRLVLISVDHCLTTLSTSCSLSADELEERFVQHYQTVTPEDQPPFAGVNEVCADIRARGGLNLIVTHRRRAGLVRLLAAHTLTADFVDIVSSDDAFPRKPDPAAFAALIEKHQLPREMTLGLGDRDIDILAAQAAGIRAAFFGTNSGAAAPDFIYNDYAQLRRCLAEEL
jgi:phosphoglycolate phosphatase-like HAD superfamily hydrolase